MNYVGAGAGISEAFFAFVLAALVAVTVMCAAAFEIRSVEEVGHSDLNPEP